ncbi:MAG TPA: hypothetical protein VFQ22_02445, partial [Longimicrobiales bacterium]|nr:hypothetical protein [Longimicrobiales bacterium]
MRLGLSSAAAPDAPLDELLAACVRRGLEVLELRDGDGHGVSEGPDAVGGAEARRRALEAGVTLSGFRAESDGSDLRLARLAVAAEAPVLVGCGCSMAFRIERARRL